MIIRTALSDKARAELTAFCADNLRADLDAARYADALDAEADFSPAYVVFEIAPRDSRTGNPITIGFGDDADFRVEEIED